MNIIFDTDLVEDIAKKYTVLELDTVRSMPGNRVYTAWCVVEKIPLPELSQLLELKQLHHDMMTQYKNREWNICEQSIGRLMHSWGTELDSFYEIMLERVRNLQDHDPGSDWDPVIDRYDS
jgi:hypothetical protein